MKTFNYVWDEFNEYKIPKFKKNSVANVLLFKWLMKGLKMVWKWHIMINIVYTSLH
jgi:hypothetical protein